MAMSSSNYKNTSSDVSCLDSGGASEKLSVDAKWEDMCSRLVAYKEKYGDCLVPNRCSEDSQLGNWVSTQRRHYKILMSRSDEATPMNLERASRLDEIGFQWFSRDPRHVPWEQRYEELVEFKEKYGHSQVPIGWEENIKLSNWVSTQRQEYKLIQKGRQSRLSHERVHQLNKIDFVWEAQRGGPRRKRRAVVAVPEKANPVDVASRSTSSPSARGNSWRGWMGKAPQRTFVPDVSWMNCSGLPDTQFTSNAMGAAPWQMMANGAFQQAFPPIGIPPGMNNPALIPMAAPRQMTAAGSLQYGTTLPGQANLQMMGQSSAVPLLGVRPPVDAMWSINESHDKKEGTNDGKISENITRW